MGHLHTSVGNHNCTHRYRCWNRQRQASRIFPRHLQLILIFPSLNSHQCFSQLLCSCLNAHCLLCGILSWSALPFLLPKLFLLCAQLNPTPISHSVSSFCTLPLSPAVFTNCFPREAVSSPTTVTMIQLLFCFLSVVLIRFQVTCRQDPCYFLHALPTLGPFFIPLVFNDSLIHRPCRLVHFNLYQRGQHLKKTMVPPQSLTQAFSTTNRL